MRIHSSVVICEKIIVVISGRKCERARTEGCDTSGNLVRSGRNQLEIIGNQLEITEIWLEIRNQDPVEIRKSQEILEK